MSKPVPVTDNTFETMVVESDQLVLVAFGRRGVGLVVKLHPFWMNSPSS
jgi:hypothetical protein